MRSVLSVLALAAVANAAPGKPTKGTVVPNNYVVVYKQNTPMAQVNAHKNQVAAMHANAVLMKRSTLKGPGRTVHIGNFKALTGEFDAMTIMQIAKDPKVAYVEASQTYTTVVEPEDLTARAAKEVVQKDAPWGLARVSSLTASGSDATGEYKHDPEGGKGVVVYVIDTGVNTGHDEFEGRASMAPTDYSKVSGEPDGEEAADAEAPTDDNGHGSHCAGTIAGKTYGVAKKAAIVGVKVLSGAGSGSTNGVIGGIDYAAKDCAERQAKDKSVLCIASMSLGGGASVALDTAVENAVKQGVFFAIAAGNDNKDAANTSPARAKGVMTVGATDSKDQRATFSNFGSTVEIFAPGVNILSAWMGPKDAKKTISGTSMATPHVAGMAAYFLSQQPKLKPLELLKVLQDSAVKCSVKGADDTSPQMVLYNGLSGKAPRGECKLNGDKPGNPGGSDPNPPNPDPPSKCFCDKLPEFIPGIIDLCKIIFC